MSDTSPEHNAPRERQERQAKMADVVREALTLDRGDTAHLFREQAEAIRQDVLKNHLPRVIEALNLGYPDENQILVIYDHLVRIRALNDIAQQIETNGND